MSSSVRAAILTAYRPPQVADGVQVFSDCLRRALGHVEIFSDDRPYTPGRLGDLRLLSLEHPVGALRTARAMLRRHAQEPFDIILTNGMYGWPLTLARPGVPLVQVYHMTMAGFARHALSHRGSRVTTGLVAGLFDRIAGLGKHVVAFSERVVRELESYYGLRARLLPLGVDTGTFLPRDAPRIREMLGLPEDVPIGLFVGRPDESKGYDILLRVSRRMPHVLFLVAGGAGGLRGNGGTYQNVWSLGHVSHEEMPQWYAASDFFFLPSRYEGFGLSTLEALSCDLPVVVTQAAWPFPEDPTRCGVAVRGGEDEEFIRAIRVVLSSKGKFASREFVVPRHDLIVFERSWKEFVDSVISGGAS